jgi:hypothetical protein
MPVSARVFKARILAVLSTLMSNVVKAASWLLLIATACALVSATTFALVMTAMLVVVNAAICAVFNATNCAVVNALICAVSMAAMPLGVIARTDAVESFTRSAVSIAAI